MKRILLAFPEAHTGYGAKKYPAIGLAYLAAKIREPGNGVEILDLREKDNDNLFKKDMADFDFVGFHCTILNSKEAIRMNKKIKEMYPKMKTIAGGPQPSMNPSEFKDFDFVIQGEGEEVINKILDGRIKEKVIKANFIENLDALPLPAWYLCGDTFDVLPVMATRGCPFMCTFCNMASIFGRKHRVRKPAAIVAEIKFLKENYKIKKFEIIDDNLTFNPDYVKEFCRLLIKEDLGLIWDCAQGARIDRLDEEAFQLLYQSGCRILAVGIESGKQEIVNNIKKGLNLEVAKKNIALARKAGLTVKGFFLVGSPGETYNDVIESIKFFKDNKIDIPRFGMLAPYPDTELYTWMQKNANVLEKDIDNYTHGSGYDDLCIPFDTPEFTKEERLKAYKIATHEADIWTIRMRFGVLAGLIARVPGALWTAKKIYFDSPLMKRLVWK
jgi:radical SAM superfamily enzyme YgiQ (UPF0313 family)